MNIETSKDRLERTQAGIAAERDRVEAIIARDKADRTRERDRKAAEIKVNSGEVVYVTEMSIDPTPEWMEKGDTKTFIPRQHNGTTKLIKTVRRVQVPFVLKMLVGGKISEDQYRACSWYRERHESAGLDGRVKSSHISLTGNTGGGGGGGQAPMALHAYEAEARNAVRRARAAIAPVLLKMFEAVVVHDIPLRRAARFIRCRNSMEMQRFRVACQDLVNHLNGDGVDLTNSIGESDD